MNYIHHLNGIFADFYADDRLHGSHISLYLAIFYYWNLHHFAEGYFANRTELMQMAKIGSRSTYHRLIRELSDWGYIEYLPSRNPKNHSTIRVSHICTDSNGIMVRTRFIFDTYCPKTVPLTLYKKQIKQNKGSVLRQPKDKKECFEYFKKKKYPIAEGKKFYNHYQGIGWKIGGKIPIVDWKSTAENWMLKGNELKEAQKETVVSYYGTRTYGNNLENDHLKTKSRKNYAEPL